MLVTDPVDCPRLGEKPRMSEGLCETAPQDLDRDLLVDDGWTPAYTCPCRLSPWAGDLVLTDHAADEPQRGRS